VRTALLLLLLLLTASAHAAEAVQRVQVQAPESADSRWKNVLGKPDTTKEFDLGQTSPFRRSPGTFHGAKGAKSRTFHIDQKFAPKSFDARTFSGAKPARAGEMKFATKNAPTSGKYDIPNASKKADTKSVEVADARESRKSMPVRDLPDGKRPYLGPESKRLHKPIDPATLGDWRNQGEMVGRSGDGTVERLSSFRELKTIEDVKELLNKN
jgi:hypothetical protein